MESEQMESRGGPDAAAMGAETAKVLIATASVGAGHKSVARALVEQLHLTAPAIDVTCQDVLDFTPGAFRKCYAGGFALAMARLPRVYGLGYWLMNRPRGRRRGLVERQRLWAERLAERGFARYLLETRPDLIVNTHFVAGPLIGHMIQHAHLNSRQVVVVTDIEVHRFWYAECVEHWFVPAEHSAEPLRRWGIPDERITVSGIPIHPKWTSRLERKDVLAEWKLPADRPIVILSGGTEFVCAPVAAIARALLDACPDLHLVVLAGRNKNLLATLSGLPEAGGRLTPLGFTDRLNELLEVGSLMLTKAGGVMTAECLAKGTPMILMKPVPGHEAGNAAYLSRQGAAVIARSVAEIVGEVRRLLDDRRSLAQMAENAGMLYKPGCQTVVSAIRRMARNRSARPGPCSGASS